MINITLVGAGMGSEDCLTNEVKKLIDQADVVFGAGRLSNPFTDNKVQEVVDTYSVADLIEWVEKRLDDTEADWDIVFIYSGDSGFYSGAEKAYSRLKEWSEDAAKRYPGLQVNIDIKAGISSVSYLASKLHVSWQDAKLLSLHGRSFEENFPKVMEAVRFGEKTFVLLSGAKDAKRLILGLKENAGLKDEKVWLGYKLSYADEKVFGVGFGDDRLSEMLERELEEGLYTVFISNPNPEKKQLSYGVPTDEYIRVEGVPITKEEIREIVLSKLRLFEGCTFYDIGSGTGGVTIDVAGVSSGIKVVAIEKKEERTALLLENMARFGLYNIKAFTGSASLILDVYNAFDDNGQKSGSEACDVVGIGKDLDTETGNETNDLLGSERAYIKDNPPDRVFIGGSEGELRSIISILKSYQRPVRVCMTAITVETKNEILKMLDEGMINAPDIVEVRISRLVKLGGQHMMKPENDIMIAAFEI
ncbi:MAG: precorrin-6Y C5,15-methyltransferase (decarboxylating) subunit CbiT [Eubacterium sp.]|nr:precorrin-6Y C5,15-methyltransferase (decarboxylating) subunit CbiT [Eubacterium sp.]